MVEPYENAVLLLCTISGIDRRSAVTVISEIGTEKKSVRITRAGVYLKPALVQVAHAAVKSNKSPYYKTKYERIMKRRGKKRAIIAIARMILTAICQMLFTGEAWNPTGLYKVDIPEPLKNRRKKRSGRL